MESWQRTRYGRGRTSHRRLGQGLLGMKVGGRRRLEIPPHLATVTIKQRYWPNET